MKLIVQTEGAREAEQLIAVLCIGICAALKSGTMSINEVENRLFSPSTMSVLEQLGLSARAVELIHMGTELEDVESLLPDRLGSAIDELAGKAVALLGSLPPMPLPRERWVKQASNE